MVLYESGRVSKASYDDYREAVYMITSLIPMGKVSTYGSIARLLGISPRLVGRILAENDKPIQIPCHRVVRSDGSLGGYTPAGIDFKKKLLQLEGITFSDGRVSKDLIIDLSWLLDP